MQMEAYQEQTASHSQNKYSHNKCITRRDGRACKADGWSMQLNVWVPEASFMFAFSLFQTLKNENNKTSNKNKTLPPFPTLFPPKTKQKKVSQNQRERTGHSRRWPASPMNEKYQMIHTGSQHEPGSAVLKCLPHLCTCQSDWGNSYPSDPQLCATAEWGILAARRLCFANATFADRTGYKLGGCQPCYWDTDSLKSATTLILMCITVPWMPQTAMFKMYLTVL